MQQARLLAERYEILRRVGAGGMGEVYLARDLPLRRPVALKILKDHLLESEAALWRFREEARAAARLSHPNVVRVFDAGTDGAEAYIAMEYVAGGTLKERISREEPLEPREAARVARGVALALCEAHQKGIVHRDVKPQNVLLTERGEPKLADFGIARAAEATPLTQTSMILGSAHYLSPEQAVGEPATPKSDLYSLGVTLYEMLTGRLPFDAENPIAIAVKHVGEWPASPRAVNPGVPQPLERLTMALLAKDPEQRPATAMAVSRALDPSVLAHEDAQEETTAILLALPAAVRRRRRRRPLVAAVLCISLLLAGLLTLADGSGYLRWAHLESTVFWQEESATRLSTLHVPDHRAPEPPARAPEPPARAPEPPARAPEPPKEEIEPQVVPSAAGEVFQQPSAPAPARRAAPDPPTNSEPAAENDVVRSTERMVREVQKGIEEAIPGFSFSDRPARGSADDALPPPNGVQRPPLHARTDPSL
jgi:hypothetical protein